MDREEINNEETSPEEGEETSPEEGVDETTPIEEDDDTTLEDYLNEEEEEDGPTEQDTDEDTDKDTDQDNEEQEESERDQTDLLAEDTGEEEEEKEFDPNDFTDRELTDQILVAGTYDELLDTAEKNDIEISERFLAEMARAKVPPEFLAENKIFNFDGFYDQITHLQREADPERVNLPKADAPPEEWAVFNAQYLGIPETKDDYGREELFADTAFSETPEVQERFLDFFHGEGLNHDQAKGVVNLFNQEREAVLETEKQDFESFVKEEEDKKVEAYGDNYKDVTKMARRVLQNHAPEELLKDLKDSRIIHSASFLAFLDSLHSAKANIARVSSGDLMDSIRSMKTEKLTGYIKQLENDKRFTDKRAKGHVKLQRVYNMAIKEKVKREA